MANEQEDMISMIMSLMMMVVMLGILPSMIGATPTPPPTPPVEGVISVSIKNPPIDANYWQLAIFDGLWFAEEGVLNVAISDVPIGEPAGWPSLPTGFTYPLLLDIMLYQFPESPHNIVHRMQSAYGSDWPDFIDASIAEAGVYEYDVLAGTFTKVA